MSDDLLDEKKKKKQQKGKKRARKVAARKKKSGKKDACYHKVKSRYDVWPSAYASGALVKCRKAGAKNWGNSKKEEIELEEIYLTEEFEEHMMYDPKTGESIKAEKEEDHTKYAEKGWTHVDPKKLEKVLKDEGGAAGMDPFVKATAASEEEIKKTLDNMPNVGQHEDGDYILEDGEEIDVLEEKRKKSKKRKKAGSESSKESSLRDWFKRKGAKGSKGGWVDCNAPDGKGGYKSCGRGSGEKRKKYPACRPTPSACKERGRGKSWGKKGKSKKENLIRTLVREETEKIKFGKTLSEGLRFHVDNEIGIADNIYRHGTDRYFSLVNEARELWAAGKLNLSEADVEIMESNLGEFIEYRGVKVPLDFPMYLEEKKAKKKKDPPVGKPTKNTGGGKKYKVFVRNPKTGRIKKITYGDAKGGLKGNWNNAEARKSFAARHNCADKKDRTKAGYWACRAHKDFGTNVPGRFW